MAFWPNLTVTLLTAELGRNVRYNHGAWSGLQWSVLVLENGGAAGIEPAPYLYSYLILLAIFYKFSKKGAKGAFA
jgi:hypothetical protein